MGRVGKRSASDEARIQVNQMQDNGVFLVPGGAFFFHTLFTRNKSNIVVSITTAFALACAAR